MRRLIFTIRLLGPSIGFYLHLPNSPRIMRETDALFYGDCYCGRFLQLFIKIHSFCRCYMDIYTSTTSTKKDNLQRVQWGTDEITVLYFHMPAANRLFQNRIGLSYNIIKSQYTTDFTTLILQCTEL